MAHDRYHFRSALSVSGLMVEVTSAYRRAWLLQAYQLATHQLPTDQLLTYQLAISP